MATLAQGLLVQWMMLSYVDQTSRHLYLSQSNLDIGPRTVNWISPLRIIVKWRYQKATSNIGTLALCTLALNLMHLAGPGLEVAGSLISLAHAAWGGTQARRTKKRTRTHARTHACTHAHTRTYKLTHAYTHTRTRTLPQAHPRSRTHAAQRSPPAPSDA